MESPLAFDRDPLFSNLSNPLVKIETRLVQQKQRFWIWKELDFFWFWNEDEPDFFGLFIERAQEHLLSFRDANRWFNEAANTTDSKKLGQILRQQLHDRNWARALTFIDPRPGKEGIWRILWRRREFSLQNAFTNRAIRFFPETNWAKDSPQWRELNGLSHNAEFFTEMFWPLLTERRGRLATAFEFLDLPVEEQKDMIRFGKGRREEFLDVMRAALIINHGKHSWAERTTFTMRFHHRTFAPLFDFSGLIHRSYINGSYLNRADTPRLERLAMSFEPHLPSDFSLQSILPSPLMLSATSNEPTLNVIAKGPFTAHETMEAIATVREWVSQNAPELLVDWQ